jgi:hypothetical protein
MELPHAALATTPQKTSDTTTLLTTTYYNNHDTMTTDQGLIRTFRRIALGPQTTMFTSATSTCQESSAILAQRPLDGMTNNDVGVQDSDNATLEGVQHSDTQT